MRRFAPLLVLAIGCSSSTDETQPDEDTGTTSETSYADTNVADSIAPDTVGEAPPACGILACDDLKTFHPKIYDAFVRNGGAPKVGDPSDLGGGVYVHAWGAGKVQDFKGGSLASVTIAEADATADWSKNAYAVYGGIRDAWLLLGGGPTFGHPMEDQHAGPGGQVQNFEKGCIGPDGSGGYDGFTACEAPVDMTPVLASIGATIKASSPGTNTAMGVEWLPTGERFAFYGDERHVSASSVKFIWAMAALNKNPIATVETPALPTFKDSNNSTAGQLIDLAGGANAINDFTSKTLGIPITSLSLCHWNYDKTRNATNCSTAMGGDNFFTPNAALSFLEHAWKRDPIGVDKGAKLLEWAKLSPRSGYGGWVGTQLPSAAKAGMHQKGGWLPPGCCGSDATYNNMNEIAIIHTPRGPYAVAILLDHGTDYWGKQTKAMEWASCVIYHAMAKDSPGGDPFKAGCTAP